MKYKLVFIEAGAATAKIEKALLPLLNDEGYRVERCDPIGKNYVYLLRK